MGRKEATNPNIYTEQIITNPFEKPGTRKNSVYIGDTAFGDSGKGIVTAEFNRLLVVQFGKVYSMRVNGGGNAGHDMEIDGVPFLANQLPTAVAQENAVALITRGTVFNPRDGVMEIERTTRTFGGRMPGQLQIDDRTPLCLDTHRVLDTVDGSTGRGIGPASEDFIGRKEATVKDLYAPDWEKKMGDHYDKKTRIIEALFEETMHEKGYASAADFPVNRLDGKPVNLGTKEEFLGRLAEDKKELKDYINPDMRGTIEKVWADESIPVTVEEAQAPGLDPFFGIRPDVTSSRPGSRYVQDGTYGVIYGDDIALKLGVTKTVYMSSVGSRWLPGEMSAQEGDYYHTEFDEFGKTTKRKRGVYHLSLPIMQALRKTANYDYLVATHIDAAQTDTPIKIVDHYTDNQGEPARYGFYQDEIDKLVPHYAEFAGWDGKATKQAREPQDLDPNAREFLDFLSGAVAPVVMARNGKDLGNHIVWWKK